MSGPHKRKRRWAPREHARIYVCAECNAEIDGRTGGRVFREHLNAAHGHEMAAGTLRLAGMEFLDGPDFYANTSKVHIGETIYGWLTESGPRGRM